ncbi:hypothetical protein VT52_014040 [Streptomyces malaysiense]|uniref:Uncharacterized protein n=1 Tax=Streptomyces malaysiense TaxID=1428626 RepID=A0A1J4Q1C6_9ACTN|nr:hypothetical protein VT52_014040 [Streptomyces malaysiense]
MYRQKKPRRSRTPGSSRRDCPAISEKSIPGRRTGAVMPTGRSAAARPRFFTQPNRALSGTERTPRTSSSRAHPTTTSVPPGASSARNRVSVSVKGRWCSTATQVMTS